MLENPLHIDELLTSLFDSCKLGIIISDASGRILWGNRYYSELAGFDIRSMIGQDIRLISQQKLVGLSGGYIIDHVMETGKEFTDVVKYVSNDFIATTATPIRSGENGPIEYLVYSITNCSESVRMEGQLKQLNAKTHALESQLSAILVQSLLPKDIVVSDYRMKQLYGIAGRLAAVDTSVMILGESGVGKDVYAKFLHSISSRKEKNFIHVNLASIPKSLFESELFGYEPRAFTGALKTGKCGLIELANEGTLFLDEVGELSLDMQAKLLQVLQDKSLRRLGSSKSIPLDVRFISATNRNLEEMVKKGEFQLDLYYRLNVVSVEIPPLRERTVEIPLLVDKFLRKFNEKYGYKKVMSRSTIDCFMAYRWPGNIRELSHMVESVVVVSTDSFITPDQLPPSFLQKISSREKWNRQTSGSLNLKEATEAMEISLIQQALQLHGSTTAAARAMGIDISTLSKKRKKYGI